MNDTDLDTTINEIAAYTGWLIDTLAPAPPPDDDARRTLFHLLHAPRPVFDDDRLVEVLKAGVESLNLLHHLLASACAAAERAGIPARKRLRTSADLLTQLGVAPAVAYRLARVGRAAQILPAVTRAQRLGAVGVEFADAVGKGIGHIADRAELSDEDRAEIVRTLMIQSNPASVNKKARAIAIARAPAQPKPGGLPVAEDARLNDMTLTQGDDGRIVATLDLDVLTGEELHAALDPLTRPVPAPDGSPDPRPAGKRRADGLGQVIRDYLSGYERPTSGGVLPHVTLTRPIAVAAANTPPGLYGAVSAQQEPDAVAVLGFTGPVGEATADLVSCDSTVDTVVVDQHGAPLDVGRSQRLFPPHIRKALIIRDRGCAVPGCGRPASWCDAHHIKPWEPDGVTSVDNGVLLCRHHHTMIHHGGWQVYLGPDRHPWFIPPPDPKHPNRKREHLRSHARRTMTLEPIAA